MDNAYYGMKQYAGSAMAAMLIFGAVAAAFVGLLAQPAYAAVSMSPSATTFFGPGFVRVLITDDSKDSSGDTIVPTIEAREGSTSLGTVSPTIFAIGTSGTFELFITTSNGPLVPAAPTHTAVPTGGVAGPFVVRVNTAPTVGNTAVGAGTTANGGVATFGANNIALTTSSALEAGNTIRVNYGGQTLDINFDDQTSTLASDRTTAGEDNEIVLSLTDRDANLDSTLVDTFTFATPANLLTSTNAITYNSALWQETGQNTGIFEQTIIVNGAAGTNVLTATLPTGNTFTAVDHEVYEAVGGATAPFAAIDSTSSTTSASVTLQNFDAVVTLTNSTTFANGLKVQVNDPDRNISTQDEDDLVAGSFALGGTAAGVVTVPGAAPSVNEAFTVNGITVTTTTATSGTITIVNTLDFSANPGATTATVGVAGTGAGLTLGTATVAIGTPGGADPNTATVTIPFSTTAAISAISVGTITVTLTTTTAAETLTTATPVASATSNPISVIVAGQAGVVSGVTFTETGDNTGIFVADLTRDSIQILTGGAVAVGPTSITLTNAVVETEPDIEFNYNDSAPQTGTSKNFKVITSIDTTAGTITSPIATVGVTDKFTLELTDPDLNTNPDTIETYTASSGTFPNGIGTLALEAANAAVTLPVTGLTISFIETGPNTGIFRASNLEMSAINAVVTGGLEDGEDVEFTYDDLMESPDEDSDTTISIGVPNEDIVVDRTTVPIPTATEAVQVNLTVTDPNANTNSGSTETVTIPVVDQIVTPASGRTLVIGDFTSGINSVITLTETGPSTGIFTEEISLLSTATVANLRDAKIAFEYGDESVTVTLRAFDGSISTNKAAVKSGDEFTITVSDQDRNRDTTVAEKTVSVVVESVDDDIDTQTFTLTETGPNTGIFQENVEVGTDIEVADLANEDFSSALELTYVDAIASDGGSDDR
ncbi:MAG: beta strand repeat-containing protein, partial [Nitrososphaera sp.]|uniref:beta strand repeat-containing protein n=1 Tax=Nitrososphaera sp. TaxID=1971748 RepID=UPI003D6F723A